MSSFSACLFSSSDPGLHKEAFSKKGKKKKNEDRPGGTFCILSTYEVDRKRASSRSVRTAEQNLIFKKRTR